MRRNFIVPALTLALCFSLSSPALAAGPQTSKETSPKETSKAAPKDKASLEDVLTYINLFGYGEMMEISVDQQVAAILASMGAQHEDVPPQSQVVIQQELRKELKGATTSALREMAKVFQRHLNKADVDYLISVGRDPRMQKVVKLQPRLAKELDTVGEGLAADVYRRAAPKIEERLQQLEGGENI